MAIRYSQIEAFRATMEARSISGAARLLNKSQPSISRFISDLETEIGFALFTRTGGRVVPTEESEALMVEVERIFFGMDHLQQKVEDIRSLPNVRLSLATIPALAFHIIPAIVSDLRTTRLSATITTAIHRSPTVIDRVRTGHVLLGICNPPIVYSGIDTIAQFRWTCVVVMPVDHALAQHEIITADDLSHHPFISIGFDYLCGTNRNLGDIKKLKNATIVETPFSYSACGYVLDGLGIAIVDPLTASFFQKLGMLVKPYESAIPYEVAVIQSSTRRESRSTNELTDVVYQHLSKIS